MPAYRPLADVLAAHLVETPAPFTHDREGRLLEGPCLIWNRAVDRHGYGVVGNKDFGDATIRRVHRAAFALATGHPLKDLKSLPELDHRCRVHACGQWTHLEPVTHRENIRRGDWGALNAARRAQTECKYGHPFTEENTYEQTLGGRGCKTCHREAQRRSYDPVKERARKARRRVT